MQHESSSACIRCANGVTGPAPASAIGRRTFLAQSALLAAGAALVACGGGGGVTTPTFSGSGSIRISDYPALTNVGGVALVNLSGSPLAVVRTDSNTFVALSRICPHQGSTVNFTGGGFLCPNHGAQFTETGVWVGGQRTTNMHAYPTSFDQATGTLSIG